MGTWDLYCSDRVRRADTGMTVWMKNVNDCVNEERSVLDSQIPEAGGTACLVGWHGEALRSVRRQRKWGKNMGLYRIFNGKEWGEQAKSSLGLAAWIISMGSGAQGLSLVVWCLVLGWLGQVDSSPECDNPWRRRLGIWALVFIWKTYSKVNCLLSLGLGWSWEG